MLTKNDLQQIREVIKEEVRPIVKEEIVVELKPIKRKLNRVAKDLRYVIGKYNERIVENKKKIIKIKQHIGMAN